MRVVRIHMSYFEIRANCFILQEARYAEAIFTISGNDVFVFQLHLKMSLIK